MTGPDLHALQRWMSLVIRDPRGAPTAVDDGDAPAVIPSAAVREGSIVRERGALSAAERLDIYNDGYFVRLPDAIGEDFPGLEHALGADAYRQLVRDYLVAHPSHHPNLIFASQALPDYLASRPDLTNVGFLAELARLEWALIEAFHAPYRDPIDVASLHAFTADDWATRRLVVQPSLRFRTFAHPVHRYLRGVAHDENPRIPAPDPEPTHLATYRRVHQGVWSELTAESLATLRAIAEGQPLGDALAHAEDAADQVGAWFQSWAADGLFVGVAAPD